MREYVLGLDFGTESARAVLVDVVTGATVATAVHTYADGVIDTRLPGSDRRLPPDWALQNPADWLAASLGFPIHGDVRAIGRSRIDG